MIDLLTTSPRFRFLQLFVRALFGKEFPSNLYKPKERTNSGKHTVTLAATVIWEDVAVDLKNLNVFNFSNKLKLSLLSEQVIN